MCSLGLKHPVSKKKQLKLLLDYDEVDTEEGKTWMVVDSAWVESLMAYLHGPTTAVAPAPGPCSNLRLLEYSLELNRWTGRFGLLQATPNFKGDYRRVSETMWKIIESLYPGSGPPIRMTYSAVDVKMPGVFDTSVWEVLADLPDPSDLAQRKEKAERMAMIIAVSNENEQKEEETKAKHDEEHQKELQAKAAEIQVTLEKEKRLAREQKVIQELLASDAKQFVLPDEIQPEEDSSEIISVASYSVGSVSSVSRSEGVPADPQLNTTVATAVTTTGTVSSTDEFSTNTVVQTTDKVRTLSRTKFNNTSGYSTFSHPSVLNNLKVGGDSDDDDYGDVVNSPDLRLTNMLRQPDSDDDDSDDDGGFQRQPLSSVLSQTSTASYSVTGAQKR